MKYLVIVAFIAVISSQYEYLGNPELIEYVNNAQSYWVAGETKFKGMLHEEFKSQNLGLIESDPIKPAQPVVITQELPDSFDSRTKWGSCIKPIRDQAQCGSCWAFSAAEVLSDRWCIATNGKVSEVLSPEDLVQCSALSLGCHGGIPSAAWAYLCRDGIPSDACYPYSSGSGSTGICDFSEKCQGNNTWVSRKSKVWNNFKTTESIKQEIMTNGPVQTKFTVYADFMNYKSGVYRHVTGAMEGGHAVKIIGWGQENNDDYWLVANSWNTDWGLEGYFKISIEHNGCGMNLGIAGLPNVDNEEPSFWCYML